MATYIGRTSAYYEEEEDSLYVPDYWTWSEDKDDKEFAGDVYELTDEGAAELEYWNECRRMNAYQRNHCFGFRNETREQMWEKLTDLKNGFIVDCNIKKFYFKKHHVKNADTGEFELCIMVVKAESYEQATLQQHTKVGFLDCDNSEISVEDLRHKDKADPRYDHGTEYYLI